MSQGSNFIGKLFGKEKKEEKIWKASYRAGEKKAQLELGKKHVPTGSVSSSISTDEEETAGAAAGSHTGASGRGGHKTESEAQIVGASAAAGTVVGATDAKHGKHSQASYGASRGHQSTRSDASSKYSGSSKGQIVTSPPKVHRSPLDQTYGGDYADGKNPTELASYKAKPANDKGLVDNSHPRYENDASAVKGEGQFFDPRDTQGGLYHSGQDKEYKHSSQDAPVGVAAAAASAALAGGVAKGEYGKDAEATHAQLQQKNLKTKPTAYAKEESEKQRAEDIATAAYNAGRRKGLSHGQQKDSSGGQEREHSKSVDPKSEHNKNKSAYNEAGLAGATAEAKRGNQGQAGKAGTSGTYGDAGTSGHAGTPGHAATSRAANAPSYGSSAPADDSYASSKDHSKYSAAELGAAGATVGAGAAGLGYAAREHETKKTLDPAVDHASTGKPDAYGKDASGSVPAASGSGYSSNAGPNTGYTDRSNVGSNAGHSGSNAGPNAGYSGSTVGSATGPNAATAKSSAPSNYDQEIKRLDQSIAETQKEIDALGTSKTTSTTPGHSSSNTPGYSSSVNPGHSSSAYPDSSSANPEYSGSSRNDDSSSNRGILGGVAAAVGLGGAGYAGSKASEKYGDSSKTTGNDATGSATTGNATTGNTTVNPATRGTTAGNATATSGSSVGTASGISDIETAAYNAGHAKGYNSKSVDAPAVSGTGSGSAYDSAPSSASGSAPVSGTRSAPVNETSGSANPGLLGGVAGAATAAGALAAAAVGFGGSSNDKEESQTGSGSTAPQSAYGTGSQTNQTNQSKSVAPSGYADSQEESLKPELEKSLYNAGYSKGQSVPSQPSVSERSQTGNSAISEDSQNSNESGYLGSAKAAIASAGVVAASAFGYEGYNKYYNDEDHTKEVVKQRENESAQAYPESDSQKYAAGAHKQPLEREDDAQNKPSSGGAADQHPGATATSGANALAKEKDSETAPQGDRTGSADSVQNSPDSEKKSEGFLSRLGWGSSNNPTPATETPEKDISTSEKDASTSESDPSVSQQGSKSSGLGAGGIGASVAGAVAGAAGAVGLSRGSQSGAEHHKVDSLVEEAAAEYSDVRQEPPHKTKGGVLEESKEKKTLPDDLDPSKDSEADKPSVDNTKLEADIAAYNKKHGFTHGKSLVEVAEESYPEIKKEPAHYGEQDEDTPRHRTPSNKNVEDGVAGVGGAAGAGIAGAAGLGASGSGKKSNESKDVGSSSKREEEPSSKDKSSHGSNVGSSSGKDSTSGSAGSGSSGLTAGSGSDPRSVGDKTPVAGAAAGKSRDESSEIEGAAYQAGGKHGRTHAAADAATGKPKTESREIEDAATRGSTGANYKNGPGGVAGGVLGGASAGALGGATLGSLGSGSSGATDGASGSAQAHPAVLSGKAIEESTENTENGDSEIEQAAYSAGLAHGRTSQSHPVNAAAGKSRQESTEIEQAAQGNTHSQPVANAATGKPKNESREIEGAAYAATIGAAGAAGVAGTSLARGSQSHSQPSTDAVTGKPRQESVEIGQAAQSAHNSNKSHPVPAVTGKSADESREIEEAAYAAGHKTGLSGQTTAGASHGQSSSGLPSGLEKELYDAGHRHGATHPSHSHGAALAAGGAGVGVAGGAAAAGLSRGSHDKEKSSGEKSSHGSSGRPVIEVIGISDRDEAQRLAQQTTRELLAKGEDLSGSKIVIDANKNEIYKTAIASGPSGAASGGKSTDKSVGNDKSAGYGNVAGSNVAGSNVSPNADTSGNAGHGHNAKGQPDASFFDSQKEVDGSQNHRGHEQVKDKLESEAERGQLGNIHADQGGVPQGQYGQAGQSGQYGQTQAGQFGQAGKTQADQYGQSRSAPSDHFSQSAGQFSQPTTSQPTSHSSGLSAGALGAAALGAAGLGAGAAALGSSHKKPDASFNDAPKEVDGSNYHHKHEQVRDTLEHKAEAGDLGNIAGAQSGNTNGSHGIGGAHLGNTSPTLSSQHQPDTSMSPRAYSGNTGATEARKHSYSHRNQSSGEDSYTEVTVSGEPDTHRAQLLANEAVGSLKGRKDIVGTKELRVDAYTGAICDQDGRFIAQLSQRRLSQVDNGFQRKSSGGIVSPPEHVRGGGADSGFGSKGGSNVGSGIGSGTGVAAAPSLKTYPVSEQGARGVEKTPQGPFSDKYDISSAQSTTKTDGGYQMPGSFF